MSKLLEPRIYSYITDGLPENHQWANKALYCGHCDTMLHASNNECMTPWVETGIENYCLACFAKIDINGEITDEYGLPS